MVAYIQTLTAPAAGFSLGGFLLRALSKHPLALAALGGATVGAYLDSTFGLSDALADSMAEFPRGLYLRILMKETAERTAEEFRNKRLAQSAARFGIIPASFLERYGLIDRSVPSALPHAANVAVDGSGAGKAAEGIRWDPKDIASNCGTAASWKCLKFVCEEKHAHRGRTRPPDAKDCRCAGDVGSQGELFSSGEIAYRLLAEQSGLAGQVFETYRRLTDRGEIARAVFKLVDRFTEDNPGTCEDSGRCGECS